MDITIEKITPDMAKKYLETNIKNNRSINISRVNEFIKIIKNGDFKTTNQGIAFDADGRLLDGQHRLLAIAESETPVDMVVARGVEKEALWAIDSGMRRSTSQYIGMMGSATYMRQNHVIAAVRMIYLISTNNSNHNISMNSKDIYDWELKHPNITKTMADLRSMHNSISSGAVLSAYIVSLANGISVEQIFDFADVISHNNTIGKNQYNCKAALDFKDWYNTTLSHVSGRGAMFAVYVETCKMIYKFANNVKNTKKACDFKITPEQIEEIELMLAQKGTII